MKHSQSLDESFDQEDVGISQGDSAGKMKILLLHGHGQSGTSFFHKTRHIRQAVEAVAIETLDQSRCRGVEFIYPNGTLSAGGQGDIDMWAWGYGDFENGTIYGLDKTINSILDIVEKHGPLTGIVGFSTGAAITAIIVSLLERQDRSDALSIKTSCPPPRFAICFSGFRLGNPIYRSLYEPQIQTPMLHFIAHLDTMIPEKLTRELFNACSHSILQDFNGTHHIPRDVNSVETIRRFVRRSLHLGVLFSDQKIEGSQLC